MNLLNVKSVDKSYGGVIANHDVSLNVPEGKIVGIIGPNGSGKTTLFNSIVGHHPIDSGEINFDGKEISSLTIPKIARLGMLRTFQQTHIYGKMTCVQNMQISSDIDANWKRIFNPFSSITCKKPLSLSMLVDVSSVPAIYAGLLCPESRNN